MSTARVRRTRRMAAALIPALLLGLPACEHRYVVEEETTCSMTSEYYGQSVDILFVVDNSGSMKDEQANLVKNFPRLIEALRSPRLGPDGSGKPCSMQDRSGCKLPNLHIGVVSTDMSIGNNQIKGCKAFMADEARLRHSPKQPGCTPPQGSFISYENGKTNIPGGGDPVQKVKDAFSCIARLGINGCGSEQPLEVAHKALDPTQKINPGFLRNDPNKDDALLVVVFITDEDDCSASNNEIFKVGFDPKSPICIGCFFRCFNHGVECDVNGHTLGPRKNCKPESTGKYLHKLDRYIEFFSKLKKTPEGKPDPGRVIMAAIAGPTSPVIVGPYNNHANLQPSCTTTLGEARPAIRIEALVHTFAPQVLDSEIAAGVPYFVDDKGVKREETLTSICEPSFSKPLERLGQSIVATLRAMCLKQPGLTEGGNVVCYQGDDMGKDLHGKKVSCQKSCLHQASLKVEQSTSSRLDTIPRCSQAMFDPSLHHTACSGTCPCWRIVPHDSCRKKTGFTPYAVEVMRKGPPVKGSYLKICSLKSMYGWGSPLLARLPQCE